MENDPCDDWTEGLPLPKPPYDGDDNKETKE